MVDPVGSSPNTLDTQSLVDKTKQGDFTGIVDPSSPFAGQQALLEFEQKMQIDSQRIELISKVLSSQDQSVRSILQGIR